MVIMTEEARRHATTIELSEPLPPQVPVGREVVVKVKVSCSEGCDLRGLPVKITVPDGSVVMGALLTCDAGANESGALALKAPLQVGEHVWRIVFAPPATAGVVHDEAALSVPIKTSPQETSLAVWDIPSPVVTGERFEIKIGAKSAAACVLGGKPIEVCDQTGAVVARGSLGETPWPGTGALYWTAVELLAPAESGLRTWTVQFAAAELDIPHAGSSSSFSTAIVRSPEHRLTVKVIDKDTAAPIPDVQIRLGAYRAATNEAGLAEVRMPKGVYDLNIWKVGYEAPARTMEVNEDVTVEVEALCLPEEDPDTVWRM
jgi:hypothetical protein